MTGEKGKKRDILWIVLFVIVFINGFEAGGYQASLWSIGKDFDLSTTSMGLYAAMELFATMLAPILLGRWADSVAKNKSIRLLLALQLIAAVTVLLTGANTLFLVCIFFLGMTTSALQFTATATGIITAATGVGGVVFTAMTGYLGDRFGLRIAMLILVSFFALSLLSALRVIRRSEQ